MTLRSDSGQLAFETGFAVRGSGTVRWTAPSGINLSAGAQKFQFGNYSADQVFSLAMTLTDSSNNTRHYSNSAMPLGDGSGVFDIYFSSLTGTGLLSDIVALNLVISDRPAAQNGSASPDVSFTFLATIPEPGAISLMALGALAFLALARGKRPAI